MSKVKAVTVYQSEDGKVHPTIAEAQRYNAQYKAMAAIKLSLETASPSHQFHTLYLDLTNSPDKLTQLRNACNKALEYHRNYGKLKKPTA